MVRVERSLRSLRKCRRYLPNLMSACCRVRPYSCSSSPSRCCWSVHNTLPSALHVAPHLTLPANQSKSSVDMIRQHARLRGRVGPSICVRRAESVVRTIVVHAGCRAPPAAEAARSVAVCCSKSAQEASCFDPGLLRCHPKRRIVSDQLSAPSATGCSGIGAELQASRSLRSSATNMNMQF